MSLDAARGPRHRDGVDQQLVIASLRESCLFARAEDRALLEISSQLRRRRFRRNETIFHQGDPGDSLHIVNTGAVKITLPSLEGEEAIIATLRRGDHFGELALLDGSPRSATAVALEQTETLTLPRETFLELLDRDKSLRESLLGGLARELRNITVQVEELHFLDLAGPSCQPAVTSGTGGRCRGGRDPPALALHPVRPGGHDRWHAPIGEQAALRAGRPRTGDHGGGHLVHPQPGGARARSRAVSGTIETRP